MNISEIHKRHHDFFNSQQTKNISFRIKSLKKFQAVLIKNEEAILEALNRDLGKSSFEAYTSEYAVVMSELKKMIKNTARWAKPKRVSSSPLNFPSKDYILPEPYGCALQISPWNYPFQLSLASLVGAVAAGNTVVLKPSEHAPKTAELIAQLIGKSFDPDHVTVVNGGANEAQELLSLRWNHIMFTGSTTIGKIVAKAAAEHLTPTVLELGGKNPCIVDATAPIELTARRIVWSKFVNCGQTCIAPDFLLVDASIKDRLLDALVNEIKKAYGDDASTSDSYSKLAHHKHFDRMLSLIKGSKLIYGGDHQRDSKYFGPTVLEIENTQHPTMDDEIFGPILPVMSYTDEETIHSVVARLERPLGFYVFSKRSTFIDKLMHRYSFGGGVANDSVIQFLNDKLPFGGVGHSGMGSYHGKHSFDAFTHAKPFVKRGTWIDPSIRYAPFPTSFGWLKTLLKSI